MDPIRGVLYGQKRHRAAFFLPIFFQEGAFLRLIRTKNDEILFFFPGIIFFRLKNSFSPPGKKKNITGEDVKTIASIASVCPGSSSNQCVESINNVKYFRHHDTRDSSGAVCFRIAWFRIDHSLWFVDQSREDNPKSAKKPY